MRAIGAWGAHHPLMLMFRRERGYLLQALGGGPMRKIASMSQVILSVAVLAMMGAAAPAADQSPAAAPAPTKPAPGFQCDDKALTGSGAGFKSSQEESEEAAKVDWLEKAKAIYADADWNAAKDAFMQCVKQGLYSKCFATGIPCRPKPQ